MEVGEIGKNGKTVIRVVVEALDTGTEIVTTQLLTMDEIAGELLQVLKGLQGLLAIRSLAMVIFRSTNNYLLYTNCLKEL